MTTGVSSHSHSLQMQPDSEGVGPGGDPYPMKIFTTLSSVFWKRLGLTCEDQDRWLWCYRCYGYRDAVKAYVNHQHRRLVLVLRSIHPDMYRESMG